MHSFEKKPCFKRLYLEKWEKDSAIRTKERITRHLLNRKIFKFGQVHLSISKKKYWTYFNFGFYYAVSRWCCLHPYIVWKIKTICFCLSVLTWTCSSSDDPGGPSGRHLHGEEGPAGGAEVQGVRQPRPLHHLDQTGQLLTSQTNCCKVVSSTLDVEGFRTLLKNKNYTLVMFIYRFQSVTTPSSTPSEWAKCYLCQNVKNDVRWVVRLLSIISNSSYRDIQGHMVCAKYRHSQACSIYHSHIFDTFNFPLQAYLLWLTAKGEWGN